MKHFKRFTEHVGFAVENDFTETLLKVDNEECVIIELYKKEDFSKSIILKYDKRLECISCYFNFDFVTFTQLKNKIEYYSIQS